MAHNTKTIKVNPADIELLMKRGVELYLEEHPEMEEMYISRKKMFHEAVKFYTKT